MYMTRPLSTCRRSASILDEHPNDGPFSGFLVITDREAEEEDTNCLGCQSISVRKLPFPQDRVLAFQPAYQDSAITRLWFIPVLDQPLSSNCYYVISAQGKYKGQSYTCSREEDKVQGCCGLVIKDFKPRAFDPRDTYQQFKIHQRHSGLFYAESTAPDGFPPLYLRKKSWKVLIWSSYQSQLDQALGLNSALRARLPEFNFNFPIMSKSSDSVLVGKWYCPLVFVREDIEPKHQMKKSMFYRMTLEQRWERVHMVDNLNMENKVNLSIHVQKETISVFDMDAVKDDSNGLDGFTWFQSIVPGNTGRAVRLGLSSMITEKIRWIQSEGGWVDDGQRGVTIERVEEFKGSGGWIRLGCYILVESFTLKRLDGSLVFKWEFNHTHTIRCAWE